MRCGGLSKTTATPRSSVTETDAAKELRENPKKNKRNLISKELERVKGCIKLSIFIY
jgi:hypothetical protein